MLNGIFYVTSASAANYYTFLGEIQEGQGTIAEDEADGISKDVEKQKILKTGYARDGCVPKIEFQQSGSRIQIMWNTFCHKWLTMEELLDEKEIRGVIDRSLIFKCMVGDVKYNIKDILKDEDSPQYKELVHLRKLLFVFKLLHQHVVFPDLKLNIKNRNAELTLPVLRIFYGGNNFETIRKALSIIIQEKTQMKNNSLESYIADTLKKIIEKHDCDKDILEITNDSFYYAFMSITDAMEESPYHLDSLSFPDGTKISKRKIFNTLTSKFKAQASRTSKGRYILINKKIIEKITKQYEVVDEIIVLNESKEQSMTLVTLVTLPEGAIPSTNSTEITPALDNNTESKDESIENEYNNTLDSIDSNNNTNIQNKLDEKELGKSAKDVNTLDAQNYPA